MTKQLNFDLENESQQEIFGQLEIFLQMLANALKDPIFSDLKPDFTGFHIAFSDGEKLFSYSIGEILPEKKSKYMYYAVNKASGLFHYNCTRSNVFTIMDSEGQPVRVLGGVQIKGKGGGVSAHHSKVDEAIIVSFLAIINIQDELEDPGDLDELLATDEFWKNFPNIINKWYMENAQDNEYIPLLAEKIAGHKVSE